MPTRHEVAPGAEDGLQRHTDPTANFASEVLGEVPGNEGNFRDGLWVQEVINAVEISHHERHWVSLPLGEARP